MTSETFTRWTCNVCETTEEKSGGTQPKGWVGYGFTKPDVPAGEKEVLGHLCENCVGRVNNTMDGRARG